MIGTIQFYRGSARRSGPVSPSHHNTSYHPGLGPSWLRPIVLWLVLALPWAGLLEAASGTDTGLAKPAQEPVPAMRVAVDPRVELTSLIFRLAGNPEYTQGRVESYSKDADRHFAAHTNHAVVRLARQLRSQRGVSYDACMSLAVLLTDAENPRLRVALDPWPASLDRRWTAQSASNFVAALHDFVRDSAFHEFLAQHRSLYDTTDTRLRELATKECHLEWFAEFFGERGPRPASPSSPRSSMADAATAPRPATNLAAKSSSASWGCGRPTTKVCPASTPACWEP